MSLSADGTTVAIGAEQTGQQTGHTRVFQLARAVWVQLGADIDGEASGDRAGSSVSLSASGNTVAVGSHFHDGGRQNQQQTGHTRVFRLVDEEWAQLGADIDGEAADDLAGCSVSLSADGTTVAIGARHNDGTSPGSQYWMPYAGHTRVYWLDDEEWVQLGADMDGDAALDNFGFSVSLSADGTIVAIGAPCERPGGAERGQAGYVRVLQWIAGAGVWVRLGADIHGEFAGEEFGYAVSLSANGTTVAIGARYHYTGGSSCAFSNPFCNETGQARVFQLIAGVWVQVGANITGEAIRDQFGFSVALSADGATIAAGAPMNDGASGDIEDIDCRWVSCGDPTNGGNDYQCGDVYGYCSPLDVNHEVSCCSDTRKSAWTWISNPSWGSGCPWSESDGFSSTVQGCQHALNFMEATDFCASVGGRLCTKEEVERSCVRSDYDCREWDCTHDFDLIWTSTETDDQSGRDTGRVKVFGRHYGDAGPTVGPSLSPSATSTSAPTALPTRPPTTPPPTRPPTACPTRRLTTSPTESSPGTCTHTFGIVALPSTFVLPGATHA